MSGHPRYFTEVACDHVGIPRLHVGCDRSLDEPNPVLLIRGEDEDGVTSFEHVAVVLSSEQMRHAIRSIEAGLEAGNPLRWPWSQFAREVIAALEAALVVSRNRSRVHRLVDALAPGEQVVLADEGATTIRRPPNAPDGAFEVYRWGSQMISPLGLVDAGVAVSLALFDRGLPYTTGPLTDEVISP